MIQCKYMSWIKGDYFCDKKKIYDFFCPCMYYETPILGSTHQERDLICH